MATSSSSAARPGSRPARPSSLTPVPSIAPSTVPTNEAVARRAYELFLERGGEHGHDVEDWLRAERELAFAQQAQAQKTKRS